MFTVSPAWQDLHKQQQWLASIHMRDLFTQDPQRFARFSVSTQGLLLDYSKQRITQETVSALCRLAETVNLKTEVHALFAGKIVNISEQRPALHTALRDLGPEPLEVNGCDIKLKMKLTLDRMENFVNALRMGKWLGSTGRVITDVLSLGIGGSDLGPSMVCEALEPYKTADMNLHFISNVDGKTLAATLRTLDPETTLCIINSKTFTTPETLQNAISIKQWLSHAVGIAQHLVGVTANPKQAESFGITKENIFEFWDCIGGRYSVWSAVGLPIALQLGMPQFKDFLQGAHDMDIHFYSAPFAKNMPVLMALLGLWNINFWGCGTQAIIPYDDRLRRFPDYLQQLEMESNGKSAKKEAGFVSYSTAPVIWGGIGCNGQHAYMQLLHQGTQVIPVDFLLAANGHPDFPDQQVLLAASCFSQSKALMEGSEPGDFATDRLYDAKFCPGNRPSNTLMYAKLSPGILGSLIALYEHKVFVQGVLWGINSFDQWGVELGKKLVKKIAPSLESTKADSELDSSTKGLIDFFQNSQKKNRNY